MTPYVPPKLNAKAKQRLSDLIHAAVDTQKIPAVFVGATDAQGALYEDCAGDVICGYPEAGAVNLDTTLQLFSTTKLVTTVACLQLVDRGLVSLDNPADVAKHLPELADFSILKGYTDDGQEIMEDQDPKGAITLRMLLSHTSGLAYAFGNVLAKWTEDHSRRPFGFLQADASLADFSQPLTFQPGTSWAYGTGLDWAGFMLERIMGQSLAAYFDEHIFTPCGMARTSFYPTSTIKESLMRLTYYTPEGKPAPLGNSFANPVMPRSEDEEKMSDVLSGGAGLFGTARDYLAFLRGVLASSSKLQSVSTSKALLSTTSFDELFKDVLTPAGKESLVKTMKMQSYHGPELLQDVAGSQIGHSVGLCLNLADSSVGRKAGSGCWDGAAKTQYWLDPTTGIAGVCFTNVLTMDPFPFMNFYNDYEKALYLALEESK